MPIILIAKSNIRLPALENTLIHAEFMIHYRRFILTMLAVIDNQQRKQFIITLSVISPGQGHSGVMYQKTTNSWGLPRTILYKYFKNMRELFVYSIETLNQIFIEQYRIILCTIKVFLGEPIEKIMLDYSPVRQRKGHPLKRGVCDYTYGVVETLCRLVHVGIRNGALHPRLSTVEMQNLYILLDSMIVRFMVVESADSRQNRKPIYQAVKTLKL